MFKKFIHIIFVLCFGLGAYASEDAKISRYVDNLLNQSFTILKNSSKSMEEKILESEILISANMDLPWMSKFVLGRYRRTIDAGQLNEFTALYSDYVVKSYGSAVKGYKDQQVKVISQQAISPNEFIVKTQLLRTDGDPLLIDYMVRRLSSDKFKVFDVITEGVSLINSHQAEFANTMSNQGYAELISDIKEKLKTLEGNKDNGNTKK